MTRRSSDKDDIKAMTAARVTLPSGPNWIQRAEWPVRWQGPCMAAGRDRSEQIDFVLRRHYSAAFSRDERARMVEMIRAWDEQNPDLARSERVEAWLGIARRVVMPRAL